MKNNHKIIIFDNYCIPLHRKTSKIWNLNITMKKSNLLWNIST